MSISSITQTNILPNSQSTSLLNEGNKIPSIGREVGMVIDTGKIVIVDLEKATHYFSQNDFPLELTIQISKALSIASAIQSKNANEKADEAITKADRATEEAEKSNAKAARLEALLKEHNRKSLTETMNWLLEGYMQSLIDEEKDRHNEKMIRGRYISGTATAVGLITFPPFALLPGAILIGNLVLSLFDFREKYEIKTEFYKIFFHFIIKYSNRELKEGRVDVKDEDFIAAAKDYANEKYKKIYDETWKQIDQERSKKYVEYHDEYGHLIGDELFNFEFEEFFHGFKCSYSSRRGWTSTDPRRRTYDQAEFERQFNWLKKIFSQMEGDYGSEITKEFDNLFKTRYIKG